MTSSALGPNASLFPEAELYQLILTFLSASPCQRAFDALRAEAEEHGLLGRCAGSANDMPVDTLAHLRMRNLPCVWQARQQ
eukprot:2150693-Prymnesium_polylepis.1